MPRGKLARISSQPHLVLPVLHVDTVRQAVRNAAVAVEQGAAGLFLIQHEGDDELLLRSYAAVRAEHLQLWVGLNFLGHDAVEAFELLPAGANGLWADNAHVD